VATQVLGWERDAARKPIDHATKVLLALSSESRYDTLMAESVSPGQTRQVLNLQLPAKAGIAATLE
jgi:hypothetical protein